MHSLSAVKSGASIKTNRNVHYSLTVSKVNVMLIGVVDVIFLSATCADITWDATVHVIPRLMNEELMITNIHPTVYVYLSGSRTVSIPRTIVPATGAVFAGNRHNFHTAAYTKFNKRGHFLLSQMHYHLPCTRILYGDILLSKTFLIGTPLKVSWLVT